MPDYKYVLFDLDGTLIDSWPKLLDTANYFFGGKITVTSEYMQDQYHLGKTLCTFLKEKAPCWKICQITAFLNFFGTNTSRTLYPLPCCPAPFSSLKISSMPES